MVVVGFVVVVVVAVVVVDDFFQIFTGRTVPQLAAAQSLHGPDG